MLVVVLSAFLPFEGPQQKHSDNNAPLKQVGPQR